MNRARPVDAGLGLSRLAQTRAIGIDRFFVAPSWIERLLFFEFVEQSAVNDVVLGLRNSPLPNIVEHQVKLFLTNAVIHFVDECDVLTGRKARTLRQSPGICRKRN